MTGRSALVCIGGGPAQMPLIDAISRRGLASIVVDRSTDVPGAHEADLHIQLSTHEPEPVLAAIGDWPGPVVGCVARSTGLALRTAAAVSAHAGVPGLTPSLVEISIRKSALRDWAASASVAMPDGRSVESGWNPVIETPVVVKPDLPSVGKKGVRFVSDAAAMGGAIEEAARLSMNGRAEVESVVDGIDVGMLFHAHLGEARILGFWDELVGVTPDGKVVGVGVSAPSVTDGTDAAHIMASAGRAIAAAHADASALLIASFRVDLAGAPTLIELHADLGGDLIAESLLPATDPSFGFFDLAVEVGMGGAGLSPALAGEPATVLYPSNGSEHPVVLATGSVEGNLRHLEAAALTAGCHPATSPGHLTWLAEHGR